MGSNSKLRVSYEVQEDMITNLPDNIISHILSFLPTKYAVLTSVLSSRWRNHWMTVQNVDIDDGHLFNHDPNLKTERFSVFVSFLVKLLGKLDSPNIQKFRLNSSSPIPLPYLLDCLTFVASRNVQVLDLGIPFGFEYRFAPRCFRGKSLKVLKIKTDYAMNLPILAECCPNLKVLFVGFKNVGGDLFEKWRLRCLQLEVLFIYARPNKADDMILEVSTPSLKRLWIVIPVELDYPFDYKFEVFAPKLEILCIKDDAMACRLLGDFPCLTSASLDVGTTELHKAFFSGERFVLQRLSNVAQTKVLGLTLDTTTALRRIRHMDLPRFLNLTGLMVTIHDYIVRKLLYDTLRASPNLQVLKLQMENKGEEGTLSKPLNWPNDPEVPVCLHRALNTVGISAFRGQFVERNVIKYLLEHARVLYIMFIETIDSSVHAIFSKRILKLPRASRNCRVEIVSR